MMRFVSVAIALIAGASGLVAALFVASSLTRPLSSAQDPFLSDPSAENAQGKPTGAPPAQAQSNSVSEPPPPALPPPSSAPAVTPPPPPPVPTPVAQPIAQPPVNPPSEATLPTSEGVSQENQANQVTNDENLSGTLQSIMEPFIYRTDNRRDPFEPFRDSGGAVPGMVGPILPLQRYDLDEIRLIGIIWNVRNPKAMFQDPNKRIHILGKDERIGRNSGYIAVIREGEVVVVETVSVRGELGYSTRVLKLVR